MRSKKVKLIKKNVVLSFAVLMITAGAVFAQTWDDVKTDAVSGSVTIQNDVTTDGTALNLGAPPVPGGFNINGGGHTITAGGSGDRFLINNQPDAVTTITNTNFAGGDVAEVGGAIQNSSSLTVKGANGGTSSFTGNTAGNGGAISNSGAGTVVLENTVFSGNAATNAGADKGFGGAIHNNSTAVGTSLSITNSTFSNNTANNYGGAIANMNGHVEIKSTLFEKNSTIQSDGGAVFNRSSMNIDSSKFSENTAKANGGAILNGLGASATTAQDITMTISNTTFDKNYAKTVGGAIMNTGNSQGKVTTLIIKEGTSFTNNGSNGTDVTMAGGAILNNSRATTTDGDTDGVLKIQGSSTSKVYFANNVAGRGGAIANYGKATIDNAVFNANGTNALGTTTSGGAIYNSNQTGTGAELVVSNSAFVNNKATSGGAIYNANTKATIIDTDFSGNKSSGNATGGALYGGNGSTSTFIAQNRDMYIGDASSVANNTDSIALAAGATGNLNAYAGRNLNINANVVGNGATSLVNINKTADDGTAYTGNVSVNGDAKIQNSNISLYNGMLSFAHDRNLGNDNILNLYGGTLNLLNNEFGSYQLQAKELNLLGNSNIMLDVDLKNQKMDSILSSNFTDGITNAGGFNLNVSGMKSITEAIGDSAKILFTDAPSLIGHVSNNGANVIEAPINKYSVTQVTQSTPGAVGNGEYFMFNKIGNSDSILAGPVAAQGAFLMMDNIYRQSFANMDMVTLMTPEQRMAWKMKNKYAAAGYHTGVFAPNVIPEERDGFYVRPFANFENVPLQNGPKVSNVSYGTLIGGDSDLIELGHGWDANYSFFGAYQGSHQAYNGVGIYQNGGSLGGVATAYKGNFWTGVTANVGASAAEASTMFGNDQFPILMTGAAWKSGYNWGLFKNKLVIQPSYMMSYTFVNVFDYTNAAGVKVTQDPLNAIEIIPGLRIIGNLKNGWQPYLGLNMTWNVMDKTKFYANEVALTELSVKPYFEYGLGLQKRWGNRFTGYGQAMIRNGGRNGIALTMGFRWALGK